MSLPSNERFLFFNKHIPIEDKKFSYSYVCLDRGKEYDKDIEVEILGESLNNDLVTEPGIRQYIGTDKKGEIYEVGIKGMFVINMRDLRSTVEIMKKRKKKEEE